MKPKSNVVLSQLSVTANNVMHKGCVGIAEELITHEEGDYSDDVPIEGNLEDYVVSLIDETVRPLYSEEYIGKIVDTIKQFAYNNDYITNSDVEYVMDIASSHIVDFQEMGGTVTILNNHKEGNQIHGNAVVKIAGFEETVYYEGEYRICDDVTIGLMEPLLIDFESVDSVLGNTLLYGNDIRAAILKLIS